MRLASRPRPTTRPGRPGPDRTGRQWTCLPSATPAATSIGTAPHNYLHLCSMPERPQAWSPVRCPLGRVQRPRWSPQSDRFRTPPAPSCPAGHRPLHPARQPNRKRCGQGNGRTARKAVGHPRSHDHKGGPPDTPSPPPVGPAFAAWQPRLARRWQDCQRDRNHGSDQAAAWCHSSVQAAPRRTALLRRLRVERRANGKASSVMAGLLCRESSERWRQPCGVDLALGPVGAFGGPASGAVFVSTAGASPSHVVVRLLCLATRTPCAGMDDRPGRVAWDKRSWPRATGR
jgi:hypothetical protein